MLMTESAVQSPTFTQTELSLVSVCAQRKCVWAGLTCDRREEYGENRQEDVGAAHDYSDLIVDESSLWVFSTPLRMAMGKNPGTG